MDSEKLELLITENMKSILGFALTRLTNAEEAQELASNIFYEIIRSADRLKDEKYFYGFMWKIAENTYHKYLREKYASASKFTMLDDDVVDENSFTLDEMLNKEMVNSLRRELSLLSKQYRDTTVLYYIEDLSCREIAEKLKISTEMVKYYLFRARKIIREGMNMERIYGEKSYCPNIFEIDFWGTSGGEDNEYREFKRRKIKGNILLVAYYSPVTIQEISLELGVAPAYLEDEISLLIDRQYLIYNNGKYLTNIPIFTLECENMINEKLKLLTEDTVKRFIAVKDNFELRFVHRFDDENLMRWQKLFLCLHYALIETENAYKEIYGDLPKNGPYSMVNGGGGQGFVWGRSKENIVDDERSSGFRGIYGYCPSRDGRGNVIAMNFCQTLNAQHFMPNYTDLIVCTAQDGFENLSADRQKLMAELGYAKGGKANFAVWTRAEYDAMRDILGECIDIVCELNKKTYQIAADVVADLAPAHIRKTAEYVGAHVFKVNSISNLVSKLWEIGWVKRVDDTSKPGICVVKKQ